MKRGDFLKKSLGSISLISAIPTLAECAKKNADPLNIEANPINSDPTKTPNNCEVTNSETAGPFPT